MLYDVTNRPYFSSVMSSVWSSIVFCTSSRSLSFLSQNGPRDRELVLDGSSEYIAHVRINIDIFVCVVQSFTSIEVSSYMFFFNKKYHKCFFFVQHDLTNRSSVGRGEERIFKNLPKNS